MHSSPESGTSGENTVLILMKKKLPKYIVKCLQAAGYDELETISNMDISDCPGNSISKVENYIDRKFSGNLEYVHDSSMLSSPFEFPPGHRDRICHFVCEIRNIDCGKDVKSKEVTKKRKDHAIKHSSIKRPKTEAVEDTEINVVTISRHVRSSITRWVQQQTNPALKKLTENEHYRLSVSPDIKIPGLFLVSMVCLVCNNVIALHQRDKSNRSSPFIISNWTRHGKNCYIAAHEAATASEKTQSNLDKYFCNRRVQPLQLQLGSVSHQAEIDIPVVEKNQKCQSVPQSHDLTDDSMPTSSNSGTVVSNGNQGF